MSEEIHDVIDSNSEWYKDLLYKDVKIFIRDNINSVSRSFVAIGYYLKYVRDNQLYKEDGYTGISDFAKAEFGISPAQASKFMSINDRFSKDGNSPILLEQYKDFSSSKLSEMLYLTDEQLEQVAITTTRAEIRDMVNPDRFSHAKTEPETKLCKWDGKSNCVAVCDSRVVCCAECPNHGHCNTECGWQDERIPIPLAQRPLESKFSIEEIVRYSVPHISIHEELKKLCAYNLPGITGKVMQLMLKQKDSGNFAGKWKFSENGFIYTPSDTQQTKTISWDEYCEAFRKDNKYSIEYYISKNKQTETVNDITKIVDNEPEIVSDVDKPLLSELDEMVLDCYNNEEGWYKEIISSEPNQVETVEADIIQTVPDDPEQYTYQDIKDEHDKLTEYVDVFRRNNDTVPGRRKAKMRLDAITLLDKEMRKQPVIEEPEPAQPELPILKNNDQRKEWAENYKAWGEWYYDEHIDCHYYKYDFLNGDRLVVEEYLDREHYWGNDRRDEQYYHLIQKNRKKYEKNKTYEKKYSHDTASMTEIVDYLKELQKK